MQSIREILTGREPVTLPVTASALEAAKTMKDEHVGAVLVVDSKKKLVGCFTERDLMTRIIVGGKDPAKVKLEKVMTPNLFTVGPERRVNEVAREMQERHIRHLPVLEGNKLIGMLSLRDLLRSHLDAKRGEVRALTAYIQGGPEAST